MTSMLDESEDGSKRLHDQAPTNRALSAAPSSDNISAMRPRVNGEEPSPKSYIDPSWDTRISIAVDPVALITTECITVTSAMRKHARWAHSSVSAILGGGPSMPSGRDISRLPRSSGRSSAVGRRQSGRTANGTTTEDDTLASRWGLRGKKGKSMQDNPLLSAFARLRNDLRGCTGELLYNFCVQWKA